VIRSGSWCVTLLLVLSVATGWMLTAFAKDLVGACCLPDGSCDVTTAEECSEKGGAFQGVDTSCASCIPSCDDGDPCTVDSWDGRKCVHEPLDCDDGNPCTTDYCSFGQCRHKPLDCDDGNPCTVDFCYGGECIYEPIDCDDKNPCTTDDCAGGECVHEPIDCDDGNPCTADSCYGGRCTHEPIDCDDKNPCTTDACDGGECAHEPIDCDDGNPCTTDSCYGGRCTHEPIDCGDGDPCTTDACDDGECVHEPLDCDDEDPCTTDDCDGGRCNHEPIDCDDGDPATEDSCSEGACVHTVSEVAGSSAIGGPEDAETGCVKANASADADESSAWGDEPRPSVWYVVEGPWEAAEVDLHRSLCRAAGRADVELRTVMYEGNQFADVEQLLLRLPEAERPDLILCSRETINRMQPSTASGFLFFDIEEMIAVDERDVDGGLLGLPGSWIDWADPERSRDAPLVGLSSLSDGSWDPGALIDPVSALEEIAGAAGAGDESDALLWSLYSSSDSSCTAGIAICEAGQPGCGQLIEAGCGDASSDATVIAPATAGGEGDAEVMPADCALLWLTKAYGVDLDQDETWQRIRSGLPQEGEEASLVEAFGVWLEANGHSDAAAWISNHEPFPEDALGYAVRFWWFREALKREDPLDVPWWFLWTRGSPSVEGDQSAAPQALMISGCVDAETGELTIEFLGH